MSTELTGSGVAASCAAALLRNLATRLRESGGDPDQINYVETVCEEFSADYEELRVQRDRARDLACKYEAIIAHQHDILAGYRAQERLDQLSA